jgi:hypothetical protein
LWPNSCAQTRPSIPPLTSTIDDPGVEPQPITPGPCTPQAFMMLVTSLMCATLLFRTEVRSALVVMLLY